VTKSEVKRLLERPRRRWEDNIELDLKEIGWQSTDYINLSQVRGRWGGGLLWTR
jgi:hypothetical protein